MQHSSAPHQPSSSPDAALLLHEALDTLADHIALLGPSGEVLAVNRAWAEFAESNGYMAEGAGIGVNYCEVCERAESADAEPSLDTAKKLRHVLAGELEGFYHDYPCHSPTEERWFRMTVRRVARPGRVSAVVTHTNRTAERLAERAERDARFHAEALRQAADLDRRRLEATLDAIPVGVWISDEQGRITHSNAEAARIWGGVAPMPMRQQDYAVYRAWSPVSGEPLAPEDWPLARTLANGGTYGPELAEIARFDGTRGFVNNYAAPILDEEGRLMGAVAINVDFTEHHAAARERERLLASLERERTQLAAVFENAPAFLAVLRGPDYVVELLNDEGREISGARDILGKPIGEALPELAGQGFFEILDHVRATGERWAGRQMPVRFARTPGGPIQTLYFDMVWQRLEQPDGEYAVVAHGVDVTEQVLATESLRVNEQRLRAQFAKLPVPTYLWEVRDDGIVLLDCNEAALSALPQFGARVIGMRADQIFPGMEEVQEDVRRCLRDDVVLRRSVEYDLGPPMGRRRFDVTVGPQQPDRVLLHAVDTTERAELEAQLRQAQKMEAVGRLAGGIAHDFNNLLTVIGAHSAFLMDALEPANPLHGDADAIHKAGVRAAGLTRQLLAFSRKQILKPSVIDLNATVEEARKLLGRLLGEDIEVVTDLVDSPQHVVADPTQIDQVLMNLAVNARDAMPTGGRLTITTRAETIAPDAPGARSIVPPGDYAVLAVRDAGTGMDATVQGRLFEPFFTTKEPGKGTGLGLATAYGIVKQSRGYIIVESAPGAGSTFHVYLPKAAAENARDAQQDASRAMARGVETILLVEDERGVREVAKRVLRREGYVVLEAEDGEAALGVSAGFDATIHLVVSDMVMPGMRGAEVVRRLREQRPGLKAILMSGYTDDEIVRRGIGTSAVPFVQKPFTAHELTQAVRAALDS